jgi:hypothetical protein
MHGGPDPLDDDLVLAQLNSLIRSESRRRMIQILFLVSFFSWLILLNIYQSLLWAQATPPNVINWFLSVVVIEGFFAIILASLTLGVAYAISWWWRSKSESTEVPEAMKHLESDKK